MRIKLTIVALSVMIIAANSQPHLESGKWTGLYSRAGKPGADVVYKITDGESLKIDMYISKLHFPITDIQLAKKTLSFSWDDGQRVKCVLTQGASGIYSGDCKSISKGEKVSHLTMKPPANNSEENGADSSQTGSPSDSAGKGKKPF